MLPVRLAGLMRGEHGMFVLLSGEMTAAPLNLAASGGQRRASEGETPGLQVNLWGHDPSNQSRERNKAEMRLAASETSSHVTAFGQTEWDPANKYSRVNVDSVTERFHFKLKELFDGERALG